MVSLGPSVALLLVWIVMTVSTTEFMVLPTAEGVRHSQPVRTRGSAGLEGLGLALLIVFGIGAALTLARYIFRRRGGGEKFVPRSVPQARGFFGGLPFHAVLRDEVSLAGALQLSFCDQFFTQVSDLVHV